VDWSSLLRKSLLKHVIEGKVEGRIEATRKRGRRRKQLLNGLEEKRGYRKLKEKALDRTLWRTRFGEEYRPAVGQPTEWINGVVSVYLVESVSQIGHLWAWLWTCVFSRRQWICLPALRLAATNLFCAVNAPFSAVIRLTEIYARINGPFLKLLLEVRNAYVPTVIR
jgi:hypothetical protein